MLQNLAGKTILVTGANKGMGYEVSLALALRKANVIMADKLDLTKSKNDIIQNSCNENIKTQYLDLCSFASVKCFAENIKQREEKIDILINNAGVFCMDKQKTVDGLDGVMQTNHLGPFLLTNLMVDLLKKSPNSRIVFVTSSGSFFHNMDVKKLTEPDYFEPHYISGAIHYYNSKLCNMVVSKILAKKLKDSTVTCNCLHPGMTSTDFLVSNANIFKKTLTVQLLKWTTKDVTDAAAATVFLATSGRITNTTGKYFENYQVRREPKVLEDEKFCTSIWSESLKLVGLDEDELCE